MSGYLAGKVWQSDLDPELKPYAAALADIANDDGTSIYPTVEYVSWLIGVDRRTVQRALAQLRTRGILVLVRQGGGRSNPSEYRLEEDALPARRSWREERAARRAVAAAEPDETPYDEAALADLENSGIMPQLPKETAAPTSINSGVGATNSGLDAETAAYTSQETAAPTPPDPSSGSVPLDPPKDPPKTRNAGARARRDASAPGMCVGDTGQEDQEEPRSGPSREYAFAQTLARQIPPEDFGRYFGDAGVLIEDGRAIVRIRGEDLLRVRDLYAVKVARAATAVGLTGAEILAFEEDAA